MSSTVKQTILLGYFLTLIITHDAILASHDNQCTYETTDGLIIDIQQSKGLGAKMLMAVPMASLEQCTEACCGEFYGECNTAWYLKNATAESNCFLALCEPEDVCKMTSIAGFTSTKVRKIVKEAPHDADWLLTTFLNKLEKNAERKNGVTSIDAIFVDDITTSAVPELTSTEMVTSVYQDNEDFTKKQSVTPKPASIKQTTKPTTVRKTTLPVRTATMSLPQKSTQKARTTQPSAVMQRIVTITQSKPTEKRTQMPTQLDTFTRIPSTGSEIKLVTTQALVEPEASSNIKLPGGNETSVILEKEKTKGVTLSYVSSNGILVAAMCFGVLFLLAVCVVVGKRWYEGYQRRHYNKMDYLINGMYN